MFTNPGLSLEFETDEKKADEMGASCVALSAGNSVFATEILDHVRQDIAGNRTPEFSKLLAAIKKAYITVRAEKSEGQIVLSALGADYLLHKKSNVPLPTYLEKQGQLYQQLVMMQGQFNLGVEFIVAGIDSRGAHISHVSNPGMTAPLDKLGYAIIGSGAIHAQIRLSMAGQTSHRGIPDTLSDVYNAKRVSEVAPGVGKATDLAIIDANGVRYCGEKTMAALEEVYVAVTKRTAPDLEKVGKAYDEERTKV
jgi:hypothetical protein